MTVKILIFIGIISLGSDAGAVARLSSAGAVARLSSAGAVARLSRRASLQSEPSLTVGLLQPTPYPTPRYDPTTFIPPLLRGKTMIVKGPNLADKIQAAQDDPAVAMVRI